MSKDNLLDFLIRQTPKNTEKALYLLLKHESVHIDLAQRHGIEHFRHAIADLRKRKELTIINCDIKTYKICDVQL